MRVRPEPPPPEPLDPAIAALLIFGWLRSGERRAYSVGGNPLLPFTLSDAELGDLWRRHRADLLAEAERLGVTDPDGLRYDAPEHAA